MSSDVPEKQVAFLSAEFELVCYAILKDLGVKAKVDGKIVSQLTAFFLRDIYRIDQQQRGSVSLAKHAGYWAFWVRKLKPISDAKLEGPDYLSEDELEFVNEIVAIYFAIHLVLENRSREPDITHVRGQQSDMVRSRCSKLRPQRCKGSTCFATYVKGYLNFNEGFFLKYITYSMRNRTFGPHHFALLIEGLIYSSCPIVNGINDA
ncbi:hypothetical protein [Pseudosulfitobacter koreensis]|uniref:Uncharacterized protein n=1 Tax=Pseudosulfitobacter koreensis TaxID=2968472 RepID=A0ABT1Z1E2_9RHOB|nr:hypothetical protein [Pseudosulfitobacter koreense]MCR8826968.1 hypothetical protein [Pseudosulfitobacter koreense]